MIKIQLLPVPSQRRSGEKIDPIKYVVAHDVGVINLTAQNNVDYYIKSSNDMQASAHVFVDDIEAIWCIPDTEKAWQVHYSAGIAPNIAPHFMNDCAIGVELCYFGDISRTKQAYSNYVALIAELCATHAVAPLAGVVAHAHLDPTRRTDPLNAFALIGKTWDSFLQDIQVELLKITTHKTMIKWTKFFTSGDPTFVTYFNESKVLGNNSQTHDFTDAEDAVAKSTSEVFIFWDNQPIGTGALAA